MEGVLEDDENNLRYRSEEDKQASWSTQYMQARPVYPPFPLYYLIIEIVSDKNGSQVGVHDNPFAKQNG